MRAAVMRQKKLVVTDLPMPEPGPGEVLVKTLACGICGSDLHALKHAEKLVDSARRSGGPFVMDLARDIVMGHEFCAEIVDHGPATTKALKTGTRVCSLPVLIRPQASRPSATRTTTRGVTASTCDSPRPCCSKCRRAFLPSTPP